MAISKLINTIKVKKKIVLISLFLIAAVGVGVVVMADKNTTRATDSEEIKTEQVTEQYLVTSIAATGTIISVESEPIIGEVMNAEIDQIFVEEGDFVNKGDILVLFKSDDLEEDLDDAIDALKDAQKRVALTREAQKRNLTDAQRNKDYQLETAKDGVNDAKDAIADLKEQKEDAKERLEDLRDTEDDAYEEYKKIKDKADKSEKEIEEASKAIDEANAKVDAAKEREKKAKNAYDDFLKQIEDNEDDNIETEDENSENDDSLSDNEIKDDANEEKLQELKKAYDIAKAERQLAEEERADVIAKHESKITQNATTLLDIQSKETAYNAAKMAREAQEAAIETLEDNIEKAEKSYKSGLKNYDNLVETQNSAIEGLKNSLALTELTSTADMEQKQVDAYKEQLENMVIEAPISGTITHLMYSDGDQYKTGTMMTIQDCEEYEIEAYVGEYDISDIAEGQKVLIKTDATRDEELEGYVDFVSPTGTRAGTEVTYKVVIKLKEKHERLRLDMSASLSIIITEHDNAICVPYNAVQKDEDGVVFVESVNTDGTIEKHEVEILLESNYYTEIKPKDDLKIGDAVKIIEEDLTFDPLEMMGVF